MYSLRYSNPIQLPKMQLTERRKYGRENAKKIQLGAKLNPVDQEAIERAAELIGVTRAEFILSAATSTAKAYLDQRQIDIDK